MPYYNPLTTVPAGRLEAMIAEARLADGPASVSAPIAAVLATLVDLWWSETAADGAVDDACDALHRLAASAADNRSAAWYVEHDERPVLA